MDNFIMNNTSYSPEFDEEKWLEIAELMTRIHYGWMYALYLTVMLVLFVATVVGNTLTCYVIYCDRNLHTTTNYYLFNLAVSDLLSSFGILLDVSGQFERPVLFVDSEIAVLIMCKMQYFCLLCLWNNSVLTVTVLAVERYIAICYPMKMRSKPRSVRKIIACIWVVAILETLPEMFLVNLTKGKSFRFCFTVPNRLARIVNGVLGIITFVLPLAVMICLYTLIGFKINVIQKQRTWKNTFNRQNSRGKVNKLIIVLTLAFLVCWTPYFAMRMIIFANNVSEMLQYEKFWYVACYLISINGWFSAVLNPLLFSVMSSKFRKSLKDLWNKKIRRRQSEMYKITATNVKEDDL